MCKYENATKKCYKELTKPKTDTNKNSTQKLVELEKIYSKNYYQVKPPPVAVYP